MPRLISIFRSTQSPGRSVINNCHPLTCCLRQLSGEGHNLPADLVVSSGVDPPRTWSRRVYAGIVTTSLLVTVFYLLRPSLLRPVATVGRVFLDC